MKYFDAQHRTRAERVGPFNLWLGTDRVVKNISGRIEYGLNGPGKDISNNIALILNYLLGYNNLKVIFSLSAFQEFYPQFVNFKIIVLSHLLCFFLHFS